MGGWVGGWMTCSHTSGPSRARSGNPMFQASLALTFMILAYSLHVKYQPFLRPPVAQDLPWASPALRAMGTSRRLRGHPPHGGPRQSVIGVVAASVGAATKNEVKRQLLHLNVLEATMLRSSIAVLVGLRSRSSKQQQQQQRGRAAAPARMHAVLLLSMANDDVFT